MRGVPAIADVAARLRWVAGHRDEAAAMGRAASAWVHKHRNVWSYGPAVLDVIEAHTRFRGVRRRHRRGPGPAGHRAPLGARLPSR